MQPQAHRRELEAAGGCRAPTLTTPDPGHQLGARSSFSSPPAPQQIGARLSQMGSRSESRSSWRKTSKTLSELLTRLGKEPQDWAWTGSWPHLWDLSVSPVQEGCLLALLSIASGILSLVVRNCSQAPSHKAGLGSRAKLALCPRGLLVRRRNAHYLPNTCRHQVTGSASVVEDFREGERMSQEQAWWRQVLAWDQIDQIQSHACTSGL